MCGTSSTAVGRARRGEAPDVLGRARLRLAAAGAVATGAEAVRTAALLVGADATHRSHPLERLTRDSQMLVHHVSVNAPSQERLEAVLLGSYRGPPASYDGLAHDVVLAVSAGECVVVCPS